MGITNQLLKYVENPETKTIVEIGAHEDSETLELAKHFKHVYSYYEYLKIPEREDGNISIKKVPYLSIIDQLQNFDVVLLENEFHHFPDVWQMKTYDRLAKNQDLFLVEWDFAGTVNKYYRAFQDCKPLCELTRDILQKFVNNKYVQIKDKTNGRFDTDIASRDEMIEFYKFMLPDHWKYGEREFLDKIKDVSYPISLWEGYDLFWIKRI